MSATLAMRNVAKADVTHTRGTAARRSEIARKKLRKTQIATMSAVAACVQINQ